MKKLFASVVLSSGVLMATQSFASEGVCKPLKPSVEAIKANFHANYLPNFIPIVMNSEQALNLTAAQCQAFMKFQKEKAPKGKELIKEINKMEAESRQMALQGASLEEIKTRHVKIAELREKLMEGKMKCHQFVKSQLTAEQYSKMINEIYPAMMAKAQAMLAAK